MKKIIKVILCLTMTLVAVFSVAGCSFFEDTSSSDGGSSEIPSFGCEIELPDSLLQSETVKINTFTPSEREEKSEMTLTEAVASVKRSSVAVITDAGSGSGTIVDIDDGVNTKNVFYIITCHHVIDEAETVTVYLPDTDYRYAENDKYTFSGKIGGDRTDDQAVSLVGGDFESDVAVLKLYVEDDEVANTVVKAKIMSRDYSCTEGETVFAIGNPTGTLPGSVTSGVISYVNRMTSVEDVGEMTLLQIGVIISPGSSGGGLFNLYGELVGITNAGNSTKLTFYAIPHRIAKSTADDNGFVNIARQLIATCSDVNYGYISGRKDTIGFTISQVQGSSSTTYIGVSSVVSGSQAEKQGLQKGDVVTAIGIDGDKHEVTKVSEISGYIDALKPGDKFTFYVLRNSVEKTIELGIYQRYFRDTTVYPQATTSSLCVAA